MKTEFKITKEQIIELKTTLHKERVDYLLNEYFPDAFKTELEVGKWYKDKQSKLLYFTLEIKDENNINAYGFDCHGIYTIATKLYEWGTTQYFTEATDKEVETALINEAKKRGLKEGIHFSSPINKFNYKTDNNVYTYQTESNRLFLSDYSIFDSGIWATIIPTMTKAEAEAKLNCKIV
jgi:hypothetical protein